MSDRLLPHSPEAELGALGCIFQAPSDSVPECIDFLGGSSEPFYDLRHRMVYEVACEMSEESEPIEVITVMQRLKDKGKLDTVGGMAFLSALPDKAPSPANLPAYLKIIREKHSLRMLIAACSEMMAGAYKAENNVEELLDSAEAKILAVSEKRAGTIAPPPNELARRAIDLIETYHQHQGKPIGIPTGLYDLDSMTLGLKGGEMVVIAGRPSMGKTSLAMNIAEHVAVELKLPVGVFSLEMSGESLMTRLICTRSKVNLKNVVKGNLVEEDFPKMTAAASNFSRAPLYIDDSAGLSIMSLRAKARRMWKRYGIKLFVIDYLQLLHSTNRKAENRQQEIADISTGIKNLAKELNVPVIVLAQLNRGSEKEDRKPRMSDLRESGQIEQDADVIGMLYKPPTKGGAEDPWAPSVDEILHIAKQRNGEVGDIPLRFFKAYTKFESAARELK